VFVDTPPGERFLVEMGLVAARYLVIPTRSDDASIDGLEITAQRFVAARETNPDLELLGVALFGTSNRAARMREAVRSTITELLEETAPVFTNEIRYLETAAYDARRRGLLVHELEGAQRRAIADRLARLRRGDRPADGLYSRDASNLAADYQHLAEEIVAKLDKTTPAEAAT
jgi:cellulose biosynthesis protein BcsQ